MPTTKAKRHVGPYRDTAREALNAALEEINFDPGFYFECEYGSDCTLFVPFEPEHEWEILAEPFYSVTREQYKVTLIQRPNTREE